MSMNLVKKKLFLAFVTLILVNSVFCANKFKIYAENQLLSVEPNVIIGGEYFDGYNLFVLERRDLTTQKAVDMNIYFYDMEGKVVIQKDIGQYGFHDVEFINSTTLLYGTSESAALWNIETDEIKHLGFYGHHDYEYNPANNTYFTLKAYFLDLGEDELYAYDRIEEYNSTGSLVWYTNTHDFISPDCWCPFRDIDFGDKRDLTHSNTVIYDDREDVIYLNCRNTNTFYKIDHKTGEMIWSLGEYGNFTMYDIDGIEKDILFYHGHSLEFVDDDTFIYFDNDQHNQTNAINRQSRMIEITIDEEKLVANITWEWRSSEEYHSAWWGDADRLPNGNRLGAFGTLGHSGTTDIGARLVEVNDKGEIVWEMNYIKIGDIAHGVYRMERVRFSPIIEVEDTLWSKSGEEASILFQTWYNFTNKYDMTGSYIIELDGQKIEEQEFIFERYWQPKDLEINIGFLDAGKYNLTITVEDEGKHKTVKEIELVVSEEDSTMTEPNNIPFSIFIGTTLTLGIITIFRKRRKGKQYGDNIR